ncbi:MAG TPA: hypothetical protein VD997_16960 [Phycisphaerales bacterium]|nr:hypothetical protein [Phycisphaerales bacterium]
MNTDLDLTDRLDAFGRSLGSSVPVEPPAAFMQGVKHQHTLTLVKRGVWAGVGAAAVVAVAVVAYRSGQESMRGRPRSPSYGEIRNVAPDDVDDAKLSPGGSGLH